MEKAGALQEIRLCPECRVPEEITEQYLWLNSGVMVQANNISRRVGFIESENLDPLYQGIGSIIGMSIEHLVVDTVRRGTVEYGRNLAVPEVRQMIREKKVPMDAVIETVLRTSRLNGFGKNEMIEYRYEEDEGDYFITRVTEPFSPALWIGITAGTYEVYSNNHFKVTCEEQSPGVYLMKAFVSTYEERFEERLPIKEYRHRDGDIRLERCASCGGPAALSGFRWLLDRGIIVNGWTNRRMVMMGPEVQDPLFKELENELGEAIPAAVVEAQRRFVKSGFYSISEVGNEGDFRTQLALRGMGNLREIRMGANGMRMCIDNAANYLMAVGMAQGLFEMAFDVGSHVEWEISEEGDLSLEVTPKHIMENLS